MEYGSAFGHGAYLGPDFTADYLRRSSDLVRRAYGGRARTPPRGGRSRTSAPTATTSARRRCALRAPQALAFRALVPYYSRFFSDPTTEHGLRPNAITDRDAAASADRVLRLDGVGGVDQPPRPRLLLHQQLAVRAARRQRSRRPNVIVWSVLSLIALLGGIGLLFGAFGRWGRRLGWHGREQATLSFRAPGDVALTPGATRDARGSSS